MHCIIAEKTIALVIKCGSARLGGHVCEVTREKTELLSVHYSPPFMSMEIFLIRDKALREPCEMNLQNVLESSL